MTCVTWEKILNIRVVRDITSTSIHKKTLTQSSELKSTGSWNSSVVLAMQSFILLAAWIALLDHLVEAFHVSSPPRTVDAQQRRRLVGGGGRDSCPPPPAPPPLGSWHTSSTSPPPSSSSLLILGAKLDGEQEEYRNAATRVLSNFMVKEGSNSSAAAAAGGNNPLQPVGVDFAAPKRTNLPLAILARALDAELYETEWFVSGRVNPAYFAETFQFQDPDVKVAGIREYARGVTKIFDQKTARAEVISTVVSAANTITCTWRLSGKVNIGPGLTIKPYIVYTDFTVDPDSGLIVFQEDRFDLPQWDILLSALFPFLIGRVTADPSPVPAPRIPPPRMPRLPAGRGSASPFDSLQAMLGGLGKKS